MRRKIKGLNAHRLFGAAQSGPGDITAFASRIEVPLQLGSRLPKRLPGAANGLLLAVLPGLFRSLARLCRRVRGLVRSVDSPLFRFACALRRLTRQFGEGTRVFGRAAQDLELLPDFLCNNPQLLGRLPIHLTRYAKQFGLYAR